MGDQPFGVPEDRPGQPEGADADDRDHQHQHRRVLGGPGDQPPGGGGERDSCGRREQPERGRASEPKTDTRRCVGLVEDGCRAVCGADRLGHHDRALELAAPEGDDVVGRRQQGRAVRDRDDAPVASQVAHHGEQDLLGLRVEVRGRLVEHDVGTVGHDDPGQREPGALPGGEAARRPRRARWPVRGRPDRRPPAPSAPRRARRSGRPTRTLSRTVPSNSHGRCGT